MRRRLLPLPRIALERSATRLIASARAACGRGMSTSLPPRAAATLGTAARRAMVASEDPRLLLGAGRLVQRGHGRAGGEGHFGLDREAALGALLRHRAVIDRLLALLVGGADL